MKILIIQLARLGDIYQMWPSLNALHRLGIETHVMARPRFREALSGAPGVRRILEFQTEDILKPLLLNSKSGIVQAMIELDRILAEAELEGYDAIVNLTFSPLSSWLVFDLEERARLRQKEIAAVGYSRHRDGALNILDDVSAYFYAQVGSRLTMFPGEPLNRISLARIFASALQQVIPELELKENDWSGPDEASNFRPEIEQLLPDSQSNGIISVHIGASQSHKTLDGHQWAEVVKSLLSKTTKSIVLLGAKEEREKTQLITRLIREYDESLLLRLKDNAGRTSLREVFEVLKNSELLIAGDSALVHMASLVHTKTLNLSCREVSHWETGPASHGSRVIMLDRHQNLTEIVALQALCLLGDGDGDADGEGSNQFVERIVSGPLEDIPTVTSDFRSDGHWSFISALYLGTEFQVPNDPRFIEGMKSLRETVSAESQQLNALLAVKDQKSKDLLKKTLVRTDELIALVARVEPRLAVLKRWRDAERIRVGPLSEAGLIRKYLSINDQLGAALDNINNAGVRNDSNDVEL